MTVPSLPPVRSTRPRFPRRVLAALVAVLALGVTAVVAPVGAQTAPSTAAGTASGWLASQLVDGERLETTFDGTAFPDYGLTADAVFAFAAAGVADPQAAAATSWLAANAAAYIGDGTDAVFAGSTAKLALVAQVRGLDARAFGGADLIARLLDREQADGRFTDLSEFGEFSNPITQSLAVLVLARQADVAPSDAAVDRLLAVTCADGGIASSLDADPATCTSGVDGTAFAVQALIAAGRPGDAAAIAAALDFLEAAQGADGGFGTAAGTAANANSTGVAAQALAAGGRSAAATAAQGFLVSLQQGCEADAADRGAIAFDTSGFDASTAARATTQAVLGLTGVPFSTLSAAGASDALPTVVCEAPATTTTSAPTTTTTPTTTPPPPADDGIGTTPPARPVTASPTFTG